MSWYAKKVRGHSPGVRLSFIDITDRSRPTYRHVLLVQPVRNDRTGVVEPRPVTIHSGGIIWYGPSIWVTDTYGGFRLFDVDDLVRVGGDELEGYRYVLPQCTTYRVSTDAGTERFRFSFVSLDRDGPLHSLVTGEYGGADASRRVARFALDPASARLRLRPRDRFASPTEVTADGPVRMQGAVPVQNRQYVATSNGRWHRGTLWTRQPGEPPQEQGPVLSVGPEDLAYWPQRDELWNVSEHPLRRYVYAMPRAQFG